MTRDEIVARLAEAFPKAYRPTDIADSVCTIVEHDPEDYYGPLIRILTFGEIADALKDGQP